jgi:hypothetical protein
MRFKHMLIHMSEFALYGWIGTIHYFIGGCILSNIIGDYSFGL